MTTNPLCPICGCPAPRKDGRQLVTCGDPFCVSDHKSNHTSGRPIGSPINYAPTAVLRVPDRETLPPNAFGQNVRTISGGRAWGSPVVLPLTRSSIA